MLRGQEGRLFDSQDNAAVGISAISARNLQETPTMAKLTLAGLYYLKTSVS